MFIVLWHHKMAEKMAVQTEYGEGRGQGAGPYVTWQKLNLLFGFVPNCLNLYSREIEEASSYIFLHILAEIITMNLKFNTTSKHFTFNRDFLISKIKY